MACLPVSDSICCMLEECAVLYKDGILEFIRRLNARVVAELEAFRPVERIAPADAFGIERIERLDEEVLRRHVTCTECKASDAVQIPVGHAFRTVAAEEGAVFKILVVRESVPRTLHVRVGLAHVEAKHPERRCRTAAGVSAVGVAAAVEITTRIGPIYAPVKGEDGSADFILRAQTEDVGHT